MDDFKEDPGLLGRPAMIGIVGNRALHVKYRTSRTIANSAAQYR